MYEPYQILGAILFGALGIYLAVFYGSAIVAYIYGAYLHDGDKEIWSLPKAIRKTNVFYYEPLMEFRKKDNTIFCAGFVFPMGYAMASSIVVTITSLTGMLIPYILMAIASAWATLYVLRSVVRLNKKLDKHASDKDAHK